MAGLVPAVSGSVCVGSVTVNGLHTWERARLGISFLRSSGATFPALTVAELFKLANTPLPVALQGHARRLIAELSGGQQQFVNVMRVLGHTHARVRLLDEVFNMLDRNATAQVKNAILENTSACTLLVGPGAAQANDQVKPKPLDTKATSVS
jgi:ABC-type branched-subunit amino acid transport system ATPase component